MSTKRFESLGLAFLILAVLFVFSPALTTTAQRQTPEAASTSGDEAAPAQTGVVEAAAGGPGFYSGNAMGFSPWPNNSTPVAWNGVRLYNPDTVSHAYELPVHLPHGATVTKFSAWVYDNNPDKDLWVTLATANLDGSGIMQMARVDSTGAQASVRMLEDATISASVIDLQNKAYWVEIYIPPGTTSGFVSFRIDYAYNAYAPLILSH